MDIRKSPIQDYTLKPVVGIANTNFDLVEKCHAVLESLNVGHHISPTQYRKFNKNNKPQKAIQILGLKRVQRFFDVFGEHVEKQAQVACVRMFINRRLSVNRKTPYGKIEQDLYQELKRLNQKGILRDYTPNTQVA